MVLYWTELYLELFVIICPSISIIIQYYERIKAQTSKITFYTFLTMSERYNYGKFIADLLY